MREYRFCQTTASRGCFRRGQDPMTGLLVAILHTQSHALIQPVTQPRERLIGEHRIRSGGVYALVSVENTARYQNVSVQDARRDSEACADVRGPMGMIR